MEKIAKKLTLVYYLVYLAAIVSAVAGYYLTFKNNLVIDAQSEDGIVLSSIFIIFIIGTIPLSMGLFQMLLKKWRTIENEDLRNAKYEKAAILRLIAIGSGIVFGVFFFYILRSQSMILCAAIAAIALFFCKPSIQKIMTDLQINQEEE